MKELESYKGYLFVTDWWGEEGIRIMSPRDYDERSGVSTRHTVGVVDNVVKARQYVEELLGGIG